MAQHTRTEVRHMEAQSSLKPIAMRDRLLLVCQFTSHVVTEQGGTSVGRTVCSSSRTGRRRSREERIGTQKRYTEGRRTRREDFGFSDISARDGRNVSSGPLTTMAGETPKPRAGLISCRMLFFFFCPSGREDGASRSSVECAAYCSGYSSKGEVVI